MSDSPKNRPSRILKVPSMMIEAPDRAPNRNCAARPPDPWHTGIAPNQPPIRFIAATEIPMEVTDGAGRCGRRSEER